MDIEQAKALGAKCDECPLRDSFNAVPTTFGSGDIAVVGEAPSTQEARRGESFVGPSAKLLDLVFKHHSISREDVTLANACMCRPSDGKAPPKTAIEACQDRLHEELAQSGASTIFALGNSAALSLLDKDGITKLRVGPGKRSPFDKLQGKRIIPTLHPAACLRQSDNFPYLVTDIGKVKATVDAFVEPRYRVFDDPVDAISVLKELEQREGDLVVDIEVDIEKDTAFDHPNRYGLLSVGLGYEQGSAVVIGESACADNGVRNALGAALRASRIIAQNGKFDLAGLYPVVGGLELYFDTMLASYCLDERPGIHGLKHMAIEYLGTPAYDDEVKKYVGPKDGYGVIPRDVLYKYNAYDVACTYSLYKMLSKRLDDEGLRKTHDFLVAASNELMFLELDGIAVDKEYLADLAVSYTHKLETIEAEIDDILVASGYQGINPRSPKQVKEALYHLKIRVDSTNEETLKKIRDYLAKSPIQEGRDYATEFIEALLRHRREAKLFGTYVKGIHNRLLEGRVYPSFLLHGTTTGRLACRNPNLQNVPRESSIKDIFVPAKPGNVFVQADYGQAELRVLTWFAQEPYFREILNDDSRDLFDELTPGLYPGVSKEEMSEAEWKELRIRVKAFVYGLGYGRTHFTIAQEFKIPEAEAKAMKNRFFDLIPNIVSFQKQLKEQIKNGEDLVTPFGRHRRFHLITQENWKSIQNEALAFLPQSTSSDICLRAMVNTRRDLSGSGAHIRNIVHDSILVDCPSDMASDVVDLLNRNMLDSAYQVVGDYVKFTTDIKIGKTWGEV